MAAELDWTDPDTPLAVGAKATAPTHLIIGGQLAGYKIRMLVRHETEGTEHAGVTSDTGAGAQGHVFSTPGTYALSLFDNVNIQFVATASPSANATAFDAKIWLQG